MNEQNIKQWDLQATKIFVELQRVESIVLGNNEEANKHRSSLRKQLQKFQQLAIQSLEEIVYLLSPRGYLTAKEKSLLHWSTQYFDLAQKLHKEANEVTELLLWTRLVQSRTLGNSHNSISADSYVSAPRIKAQKKRLKKVKLGLNRRIQDLLDEKTKLSNSYNYLVLVRANRDAAGSMNGSFGVDLETALKHPSLESLERLLLNASMRIRKQKKKTYLETFNKLNALVARSIRAAMPKKAVNVSDWEEINKFGSKSLKSLDIFAEQLIQLNMPKKKIEALLADSHVKQAKSNRKYSNHLEFE
ncbi:MAG: hypothetical protein R3B45_01035 [Bdellovibrionota bacterium]